MKTRKVNLYKWTVADELRPMLAGVFHDAEKEVAVATDAHTMIISKSDYNADYAGKVVNKKGDQIDGKYPDYTRCMPRNGEIVNIDRELLKNNLEIAKSHNKKHKSSPVFYIEIAQDLVLSIRGCEQLLSLPENMIFTWGGGYTALVGKNDNYTAVFMTVKGYTSATIPLKSVAILEKVRNEMPKWNEMVERNAFGEQLQSISEFFADEAETEYQKNEFTQLVEIFSTINRLHQNRGYLSNQLNAIRLATLDQLIKTIEDYFGVVVAWMVTE